jgi:hypothetical protein
MLHQEKSGNPALGAEKTPLSRSAAIALPWQSRIGKDDDSSKLNQDKIDCQQSGFLVGS